MEAQRKRKEEEARQIAEMQRLNRDSRAREKGYASYEDMVEKERKAAWDAAFLAAVAAEQKRKKEKSAVIGDDEDAWLKKKAAQDKSTFGVGLSAPKESEPPDLAALAAAIGAARVQREYEETAKVQDNKPWWQEAWDSTKMAIITGVYQSARFIDKTYDQIYDYHGSAITPSGVSKQLWSSLPGVPPSSSSNYIYNQFHVSQFPAGWPSRNECVTAATIQDINMVQDTLSSKFGIPILPHSDLVSFTKMFDSLGPRNWLTRPPANVPFLGGMLLPQKAERVLDAHSRWLRENYGCGYSVELTSGNTVDDLIQNLQNGYPTSIHISQPISLFDEGGIGYLAVFGGMPHTVTLAGYDTNTDTWYILDPANSSGYTEWSTQKLMDLWGRKFLFYPPRFSMTTLIPDTVCATPINKAVPSVTEFANATITPDNIPTPAPPLATETPTLTPSATEETPKP
jgi:hypothetical protein